jgi:outer membrane protein, multidrug efflux system
MKRLLPLLLLSGCMVGPNYEPPNISLSEEWIGEKNSGEILTDWWNVFNDPLLTKYIDKAIAFNHDVLSAEANILQARALRQVAASALFPKIGADFAGLKAYFSKNGPFFAGAAATASPFSQILPLFNLFFDSTWEIDLFGKTRRSIEAADAQIGEAIEEKNSTLLSVMAEIALNYIELRSNQQLALLTEQNINCIEKNSAITYENWKKGYANQLDYETIEAQLASAKSELPPYVAASYKNIYTISILTGVEPETLLPELLPTQPLPCIPRTVAVGLKSDLLRRRPDVRYAERQLATATANIGVSVASFFPSITLFGLGGLTSTTWDKFFEWKSRSWAYGGNVSQPIFEGGKLFDNLHASQAAGVFASEHYQQTVLNALADAESALITFDKAIESAKNLYEALQKNQILTRLTQERYEKGLVNLISYLNIQVQYIAAEESYISSKTSALVALISLYKSLGGGWENGKAEDKI